MTVGTNVGRSMLYRNSNFDIDFKDLDTLIAGLSLGGSLRSPWQEMSRLSLEGNIPDVLKV